MTRTANEISPEIAGIVGKMRAARDAKNYSDARALGEGIDRKTCTPSELELIDGERALALYKDPAVPPFDALDDSLAILEPHLPNCESPELLGIAAAIEKRLFQRDLQQQHLTRGVVFAERGHNCDKRSGWRECGYPGINAAFMLDLLAAVEGVVEPVVLRSRAEAIRREIVESETDLRARATEPGRDPGQIYFALVTLAEAALGIGAYNRAATYLAEAAGVEAVAPWKKETTGRQLATMLRLHAGERPVDPGASVALEKLFPPEHARALLAGVFRGKLGLALSGGGFRASFYHLGVLRHLAEIDLLRHVEVLSCVSGGSIVGMQYYLGLQKLLESRDDNLTRDEYVALVDQVIDEFAPAVEKNIRMRVLLHPLENIRMLEGRRSRTERAGELYEELIYRSSKDPRRPTATDPRRRMSDLLIRPSENENFHPLHDNWSRHNKVPVLVINATSLNTGHPWQFTASEMGEPVPERAAGGEADVNDRYVCAPYGDFKTEDDRRMAIGRAVGASACVPGIFEPLVLADAYPGGGKVCLVDGGVHDNQGAAALLQHGCNSIVVSDASGQMSTSSEPSADIPGVLVRSDTVLQARVRESLFQNLKSRQRGRLLFAVAFMHLKSGFEPRTFRVRGRATEVQTKLPYSIPRPIQERLAEIRTDLDAFNELERTLLMASGYRMAQHYVKPRQFDLGATAPAPPPSWKDDADLVFGRPEAENKRVIQVLRAAASVFGKVWLIHPRARALGWSLAAVALGLAAWLIYERWSLPVTTVTVGGAMFAIGSFLLPKLLPWTEPWVAWRRRPRTWAMGFGLAIVAWLSIHCADPIYLRAGRMPRSARPRP